MLGVVPPEERTYWIRFIKSAWGWPNERIAAEGAYYRKDIEDAMAGALRMYNLTQGREGWFAGRPDEVALYISQYGGEVPTFTPAPDTPYYAPNNAAAVMTQQSLAEQGMKTIFNTGALSIIDNENPTAGPSAFTTGGGVSVPRSPTPTVVTPGGGQTPVSVYVPTGSYVTAEPGGSNIAVGEPSPGSGGIDGKTIALILGALALMG